MGFLIIVENKKNRILINHELIHIAQWRELWFIGFIGWYLWEQIKKGYKNNRFEKEAYQHQHNLKYLSSRKKFAFLQY